ncbi:MAG: 16S rRNA (guanine(527)-N(7))-methyltransferase RsmG [Pseudomonadota bacterium]|nr:16S rRNA (guanine(527)-N(7))-methyltransferase RsmG [Pseudomonadota bacterium]
MLEIQNEDKVAFLAQFPVSYETAKLLEQYAFLLCDWNEKFNLVATSTLDTLWRRHFMDSAQLLRFIPEKAANIADLGSGAGFPGLVLSILGARGVVLIESTGKKADFLRKVIEDLGLTARVLQERIENITEPKFDVITARALKPLPELLKLAQRLTKKETICLFLKGQKLDAELTESSQWWRFTHQRHVSLSDPSGNVLIIRDLQYKNAAPRKPHKRNRA